MLQRNDARSPCSPPSSPSQYLSMQCCFPCEVAVLLLVQSRGYRTSPSGNGRDMRAALMYAAGDVRVEDVPDPAITEPTDAVVRITRACICGSDLWPYASLVQQETGRAMGHEAIGVVEDVGADVSTVKKGDVVIMPFAFSDGTCVFCQEGLQTECVHGGFFDGYGTSAAQAEAIRVPLADGTLF